MISSHQLLNLSNELVGSDKMRGLPIMDFHEYFSYSLRYALNWVGTCF